MSVDTLLPLSKHVQPYQWQPGSPRANATNPKDRRSRTDVVSYELLNWFEALGAGSCHSARTMSIPYSPPQETTWIYTDAPSPPSRRTNSRRIAAQKITLMKKHHHLSKRPNWGTSVLLPATDCRSDISIYFLSVFLLFYLYTFFHFRILFFFLN